MFLCVFLFVRGSARDFQARAARGPEGTGKLLVAPRRIGEDYALGDVSRDEARQRATDLLDQGQRATCELLAEDVWGLNNSTPPPNM